MLGIVVGCAHGIALGMGKLPFDGLMGPSLYLLGFRNVLISAEVLIWWAVLGSNQWLPPCEGGTLPLS